ncbi:MAG: cellulase family glycosylhydrolase [Gammaproteobacteria bacterium]
MEKIRLWDNQSGPHLRGAVVYQRRYYADLGDEALGGPPAGPPIKQDDFNDLAAGGANAVVLSHPGVFTEDPPYRIDHSIVDHLDQLLKMAERAGLFAVIALRTGPGRSEFTFLQEGLGSWFGPEKLNDRVWSSQEAQDAWVAMWRFLAERYRDNPGVIGYELMVEPNSNDVGSDIRSDRLDIHHPTQFYRDYRGTLYDWNQLHPRIQKAIREVDPDTPILISGNGYASTAWLPYIQGLSDEKIVYVAHQYEPHSYTHQDSAPPLRYPGWVDTEDDGRRERFDSEMLGTILEPIAETIRKEQVPIAVTEFGIVRWAPGAKQFLTDTMAVLEKLGVSYFVYEWGTRHTPYTKIDNAFFFEIGPDQKHVTAQPGNELLSTVCQYWRKNSLRPSRITVR